MEWAQQDKGSFWHGSCPGCKRTFYLAEVLLFPELMRCPCGWVWCNIADENAATRSIPAIAPQVKVGGQK